MGLYSGELIFGRISASNIFFLECGGGGGGVVFSGGLIFYEACYRNFTVIGAHIYFFKSSEELSL